MKSNKTIIPQVTLVGAGPGDPELLTIKGLQAIRSADIVLYDALVSKEVINYAPITSRRIYVGKRSNNHALSQDGINKLIVESAYKYGHVVRIKGGDPFVFGRGHEELEYAESLGVPVNIIPGLSSSISVPELQHIPVTRRGISNGFHVLTGTVSSGELNPEIAKAVSSESTLVILMGVKKLPEIARLFQLAGKGSIPFALIQNGSLPTENIALGTANDIVEIAREENVGAPAVIVVGEVVNLHPLAVEAREIKDKVEVLTYLN